jgi:hypothetical protein
MKRVFSVLAIALLVAAMVVASALPALATPKAGAGCKGLLNAIAKQTEHRPGGPNPVLVAKAAARGCTTTPTTT